MTEVDLVQQEASDNRITEEWRNWFKLEWFKVMWCAKAIKYKGNYLKALNELEEIL